MLTHAYFDVFWFKKVCTNVADMYLQPKVTNKNWRWEDKKGPEHAEADRLLDGIHSYLFDSVRCDR